METLKFLKIFKVGGCYDVITKYKEIPVKVHLKLNWADEESRLLGFDWGKTHLRAAFSTLDPVYVRLSQNEYVQTQVFSNLGKELVLSVENFVEPPEFIKRRSVRVEPDENKPVIIEVEFDKSRLNTRAKDISETGVGVSLSVDENREFINFLQKRLESIKENEFIEFSVRIHLPDNGMARGRGKLKNVIGLGRDVYVRLGFEVDFPREELNKIRKYVMERQKEIIQSLRMLK